MLDGCTMPSSYGSRTTRPALISALMSPSESSISAGYPAWRGGRPPPRARYNLPVIAALGLASRV